MVGVSFYQAFMHNLAVFLQKYHYWLLFLLLEVVSLVLFFQHNSYQSSVWFTSANYISGKVYEASATVNQFFSLTAVNRQLTLRNVVLEQQVSRLSEHIRRLEGDTLSTSQLFPTALSDMKTIPAVVVSNTIDRPDNFITIDKGTDDGVHPDMGVVSGTGVVGIVYKSSRRYSIVIPVLSSHSRISCRIAGRGYFGYLHWTGGSSRYAYVDDIPRHAHFRLYDTVVTSGYSSVFPENILIGKILHVYNSPDGLSYRLMIELSTDFGSLRDVCVIDDAAIHERLDLLRSAEDSITTRKDH